MDDFNSPHDQGKLKRQKEKEHKTYQIAYGCHSRTFIPPSNQSEEENQTYHHNQYTPNKAAERELQEVKKSHGIIPYAGEARSWYSFKLAKEKREPISLLVPL